MRVANLINEVWERKAEWYLFLRRSGTKAQVLLATCSYQKLRVSSLAFSSMIGSRDSSFPGSWDHEAQAPTTATVSAYSKVSRCLEHRAMEEYSFANSNALDFPIHVKMLVLSSKLRVCLPNQTFAELVSRGNTLRRRYPCY